MMGDTEPREADTEPDTGPGRQMMGDTEARETDTAPDTEPGRQMMGVKWWETTDGRQIAERQTQPLPQDLGKK